MTWPTGTLIRMHNSWPLIGWPVLHYVRGYVSDASYAFEPGSFGLVDSPLDPETERIRVITEDGRVACGHYAWFEPVY